jgi:very-short-patch-repair endonuclease
MKARISPPTKLLSLAAAQAGVVSREQVSAVGLTRRPLERLIAEGRWQRLDRGLYLASDQPPDWLGLAWGGLLLGGQEARLGGRSAGFLHGLNAKPDPIDVLIPWQSVIASRGAWRFVRERPGARASRSVGEPPRLTIEDTVFDLTQGASEAEAIDLVMRAVQTRRTSADRLRRLMQNRGRLHHRKLLGNLLGDVAAGAQSALELEYLRDVERAHQLPEGTRQQPAGSTWQDVLYEEFATLVELDGRLGHEGMGRFRDMRRDNASLVRGQATLRYGYIDVHCRGCFVAAEVATVLTMRGWTGLFMRCTRCHNAPDEGIG